MNTLPGEEGEVPNPLSLYVFQLIVDKLMTMLEDAPNDTAEIALPTILVRDRFDYDL
jgi:hypothetical protein